MFRRLDADADGRLKLAEVPEPFRPPFERLMSLANQDADGDLSEKEFLRAAKRLGSFMAMADSAPEASDRPGAKRIVRQILKRMDRDGDRQVSRNEAGPRLAERFDQLDSDRNGVLDVRELEQLAEFMWRQNDARNKSAGRRRSK